MAKRKILEEPTEGVFDERTSNSHPSIAHKDGAPDAVLTLWTGLCYGASQ
jgi:hypothetical protein